MNELVLTGISTEINVRTGDCSHFLVFNEGVARLPVSEEAALKATHIIAGLQSHAVSTDGVETARCPEGDNNNGVHIESEPESGNDYAPSEEDISAVIAQDSEHGVPEGAEIFSASVDDYSNPPEQYIEEDGVVQF